MTSRLRRFYLVATWMPILLPALAMAIFAAYGGDTGAGASNLIDLGRFLIMSLTFGGIPYLVVACWAQYWLVRKAETERQVRRLMVCAPLIVALATALTWTIFLWITDELSSGALVGGICALYVLPLGYAYVLLTMLARAAMPWLGAPAEQLDQPV